MRAETDAQKENSLRHNMGAHKLCAKTFHKLLKADYSDSVTQYAITKRKISAALRNGNSVAKWSPVPSTSSGVQNSMQPSSSEHVVVPHYVLYTGSDFDSDNSVLDKTNELPNAREKIAHSVLLCPITDVNMPLTESICLLISVFES
ncbi:unnamed protein product [Parnassius apollo]|uniref:(apollo) hypothetical protein n=1 Tax=Parnassius apollo TaxID=110799 RepID=A0A8S3WZM5_PARAO|nr:unnamed protein product [Parnassius apollo]